jgi:flavin reductase (DIM6/NTAB) family NADH-FMN oxidoreductase RutF
LRDAAGAIDCTLEEGIERVGVVIAIGRVVDFTTSKRPPLIFLRGQYVSTPATEGPSR